MSQLDSQHEIIGRENELRELRENLSRASEGQGCTLLISGEAGIGKTKLLDELKREARSRGFRVLSGNSLHESLTPYMPFLEALRSGGLEHLFAEEAPKVEAVYLVTDTGLLIKEVLREETELDPNTFASMLTTVGNFVRDSLSMLSGEEKEGTLNTLGYENYRILIESGRNTNLVVILTGREIEFLINDMREIIARVDENYGSVLRQWRGDDESVHGIEELMEPLVTSGKYDGIYYGKGDPRARRNLLFENVSLGLIRLVRTEPTLLCIEDLQWADPSSLALMHYVARSTRKSNLLIVGTYRPEDIAAAKDGEVHQLVDVMQLMNREDLYHKIELKRLGEVNTQELLESLLGKVEVTSEFKTLLFKETEGNPLFVLELAKMLVEDGVLAKREGIWVSAKNLEEVRIPSRVRDVIVRRLGRLKENERDALDYAAVIGEEFSPITLSEAMGTEKIHTLRILSSLEQKHRLIRPAGEKYKFDHAKIKEVLYSEISGMLRKEYHAFVAAAIEELHKDDPDKVAGDLAYHYYRCRNKEKGVPSLVRAAEKAKQEFANKEAIRFYSEALELVDERQERLEILKNLGDVFDLIGEYQRGTECYREAVNLADEIRTKSELLAKIGALYEKRGEYDKALEELSKGTTLLKKERIAELGRIIALKGVVYMRKGNYDDALEHCRSALEIFEEFKGEKKDVADASNTIGTVHWYKGDYDKALEYYEKSLAIREKIGDQRGIAMFLSNIGSVHTQRGEYDKALQHYEKSLEIEEKIGDQRGIAMLLNNIGNVHARRGEYDKALQRYEKSLAIAEKIGDQKGTAMSLSNIGSVHKGKGEYDTALQHYEKSLAIREKIGDQRGIAMLLNNIGNVHARRGENERALQHYEKSLEIREKIGDQSGMAASLGNIGNVHWATGEYDRALQHYEKSLEIAEKIGHQRGIAVFLNNIGNVHKDKGEYDKAFEYYEKSLAIRERIGDLRGATSNYCGIAEIYLEKRDLKRALDFCNRTFDMSKEIGVRENIGNSRRIFGMIYREQEEWKESIRNFEQSVKILKELGMKSELGQACHDFGLMYKDKGDKQEAKEQLEEAMKIFKELGNRSMVERVSFELKGVT